MIPIFIILSLLIIALFYIKRRNEKFRIVITQSPRGIDAMAGRREGAEGRRTITPDIFPDHIIGEDDLTANFFDKEDDLNKDYFRKENLTMMPSGFADQAPDKVLGRYMAGEAFAEDFTNTRACMGAAKLDKQSGFSLPTRWEDTVCETHCPDYSMVGTRADNAGNLSIQSRDALYDHVGWNIKEIGTDTNEKEYISAQNYTFTDRDSG